jgi:PPK2 family polyphosphate:nucleotide phosphotransferase
MDYRKKFLVEPGAKVRLADFDPGFRPDRSAKSDAFAEIEGARRELGKTQYRMFSEHRHALLIVLQGMDASGKDSTVRHVFTGMNPTGCRVTSFKQPTAEELDHDFLWRVHPHAPRRGEVAIFNRSHCEDVLVVRVHQLVPRKVWSKRYDLINQFERALQLENNTTILKFFLHISKEEQLARFAKRLSDPLRQWKISESDYRDRAYWDQYIEAYEELLSRTSTEYGPWFVIPANRKWFRDLVICHITLETMRSMDIQLPKPSVDLEWIRETFHRLQKEQASGTSPE